MLGVLLVGCQGFVLGGSGQGSRNEKPGGGFGGGVVEPGAECQGSDLFACDADGQTRYRCFDGQVEVDVCPEACVKRGSDEDDVCGPLDDGIVDSIDEANAFFINQWGPTAFTSGGAPFGYSDCMPTSGLMVLSALGLVESPSPGSALGAIDDVRDAAFGYDTGYSQGITFTTLDKGMLAFGAAPTYHGTNADALDEVLARGSYVVAAGNAWRAWGYELHSQHGYLNNWDPGPHAVAILGKTPEGRYLVADPLSTVGAIEADLGQVRILLSSNLPGMAEYNR